MDYSGNSEDGAHDTVEAGAARVIPKGRSDDFSPTWSAAMLQLFLTGFAFYLGWRGDPWGWVVLLATILTAVLFFFGGPAIFGIGWLISIAAICLSFFLGQWASRFRAARKSNSN